MVIIILLNIINIVIIIYHHISFIYYGSYHLWILISYHIHIYIYHSKKKTQKCLPDITPNPNLTLKSPYSLRLLAKHRAVLPRNRKRQYRGLGPALRCEDRQVSRQFGITTHSIHGRNGIFTYISWLIFMVNVGKYSIITGNNPKKLEKP